MLIASKRSVERFFSKLDSLPDTLTDLVAYKNNFSGSIDLTQLPTAMLDLVLGNNRLSGSVVLTKLPSSLKSFLLPNNQFNGGLDLTRLPSSMCRVSLCCNSFSANPTKGHLSVGKAKNLFKPLVVFLSWRRPC